MPRLLFVDTFLGDEYRRRVWSCLFLGVIFLCVFWDGRSGRKISSGGEVVAVESRSRLEEVGLVDVLTLLNAHEEEVLLADVRAHDEFLAAHIPFSVAAHPAACTCELSEEFRKASAGKSWIIVFGVRGQDFSGFLSQVDEETKPKILLYSGGVEEWKSCGLPWEVAQ
jgi:rhodanese-related sulfurtransferase